MASLKFVTNHCRAKTSLLRVCQTYHNAIDHRVANGASFFPRFIDGNLKSSHTTNNDRQLRCFHSAYYVQKNCNDSKELDNNNSIAETSAESKIQGVGLGGNSFSGVPGTTNTKQKTLAIIFTCTKCNTRSAKQFTEHAYKKGVVLVRCPGCQNLHLIADRLGWFDDDNDGGSSGEGWDIEKAMARAGEHVRAVTGEDVLELTTDDIAGKSSGS